MTFTVVGTLADFGTQPRAGVRVRANGVPTIKVAGGVVYSDATETTTTDEDGAFTLDLVSVVGLWYTIRTDYGATSAATFAGYVPDALDPTTGVPLVDGTVIDLADVVTEDPAPGYAVTVGPTGASGPAGPTGPAGSPTAFELRGTGSPEGAVTAAVGTYYTDTAGTTGAWRWLKKTGAGTTGWVVVIGDTGWRNVSSLLKNGWTGLANLRRAGDTIELRVSALNAAAATTGVPITLPAGFTSSTGGSAEIRSIVYTTALVQRRAALSADLTITSYTAGDILYGAMVGTTTDAWPTTLPGA